MRRGVINLETITAYAYNAEKDCYDKRKERGVSCYSVGKIKPGKRTEYDGSIVIRIFTDRDISISVGDRIALYDSDSERPPENSHKVISVADNRRAITSVMRHWRLELE